MTRSTRALAALLALAAPSAAGDLEPASDVPPPPWPGFGGPGRDFRVEAPPLAESWPEDGPPVVWRRAFGEGYSGLAHDGTRLFSMRRDTETDEEIVAAIDAATGETLWEHAYPAPIEEDMDVEFGPGPHVTPLLADGLVFTVGVTVKAFALDRATGAVRWTRDLRDEFGATHVKRGYCASPIAHRDLLILPIGGEDQAVMALRRSDGEVAWKAQTFGWAYAAPTMIEWDDGPELIAFWNDAVGGLDPDTGTLRWSLEHRNATRVNISTPVWDPARGVLFVSSAYGLGSIGVRLRRADGETLAEQAWHERRLQVHHGNAVLCGDRVYASSGSGPAVFAALELETGALVFRDRAFGKSNLVGADGKLIVLDEQGDLALVRPTEEGFEVLARAPLLRDNAWSAPALVGSRLFARDRHEMVCVELGRGT